MLILLITTFACKAIALPNSGSETTPSSQSDGKENATETSNNENVLPINIEWSTFLGIKEANANISDVVKDDSGNLYILMFQFDQAGDDTRHMSLKKLNANGKLEWSTIITSTLKADGGSRLAIDNQGNIYITGTSDESWGSPINPFVARSTTPHQDSFLVKVDSNGAILWNTFLEKRYLAGITIDEKDDIYLLNLDSGASKLSEISLLTLNTDGGIRKTYDLANIYNTTSTEIFPQEITLDKDGNIYVYGYETGITETPHDWSIFIAKLSNSGDLLWKTLLKNYSAGHAEMLKAVTDNNGNLYIVSESYKSWGNPISSYDGGRDYEDPTIEYLNGVEHFVAKLDTNGNIAWNTFLNKSTIISDCAITSDGHLYLAGYSNSSWGTPIAQYNGENDGVIVKMNPDGSIAWNTFIGGEGSDYIERITLNEEKIFSVGESTATFGSPISPINISPDNHFDIFVINLQFH